jgi:hypothetical protein
VESRNPPDPGWEHAWKQDYQDDIVRSFLYKWITFFRRGIILYLEYQSVCSFVLIVSPRPPLPQASVSPPTGTKEGGGGNTRLRVRDRGEPSRTTGEKACHSVYSELLPTIICIGLRTAAVS